MRSIWIKAALLIAGVWLIAGAIIYGSKRSRPTPAAIELFVAQHPLTARAPTERQKVVDEVAAKMNQLTYDERRELRVQRRLDPFFRTLSPAEQSRFLDLTLPTGFKQMMDAFNKMDAVKRQRFVERALRDLREREDDPSPADAEDPNVKKIIEQGLQAFYSDASAETKLDLSPLIEQFQKNLQGFK